MYRVRLFAGTAIEDANGPISGAILQRHRLALIALLSSAPNQQVSRDKLIGCLWPERDAVRARHLLRSAVHVLRRSLGESAIQSLHDDLRLNAELVSSDVGDFVDLLARAQLEQAVGLYRGPFLDGFHLSESPEFELWLDTERTHLARLYRGALEQLGERAQARGDGVAAVEWWRQLAGADPYSARIALELMRALDLTGDRAAALRHARLHEQLLENELGAQPDPDITAYAEQLRTAPTPRSVPIVEKPRLEMPALAVAEIATVRANAERAPAPDRRRRLAISTAAIVLIAAAAISAYVLVGPRGAAREVAVAAPAFPPSSRTIAVLPFTNVNGDPNEEYFSDGLTEELIAALAQLRSLQVAARTSVFAFKSDNRDIREIGRALNVAAVLEGSVRKEGDRVRVHAQLIDAADGFHIWTESYDRKISDIFDLQTELALRIAEALATQLTAVDRQRLAKPPTENLEAHAAYLRGRYHWKQRTGNGLTKAIEYFEEAIKADPRYARAHAGLAIAYGPMGVHGYLPPSVAKEHMRAAVVRALEIDPDLAEARAALGSYLSLYELDFVGAEKEFLRAIELDSGESLSHAWYGFMLESLGRNEEAIAQRTLARDLDPVTGFTNSGLGVSLLLAGRTASAIEHLTRALELDSTYWQSLLHMGVAYEMRRQYDQAIRAFEQAQKFGGESPKPKAGLAGALAKAGRVAEAHRILDVLRTDAERSGVHAPVVATTLLALGDPAGALDWLELAYREKHPDLANLLADPRCLPLHAHARFLDLRRRIGLDR